jgi:hypothetical protein
VRLKDGDAGRGEAVYSHVGCGCTLNLPKAQGAIRAGREQRAPVRHEDDGGHLGRVALQHARRRSLAFLRQRPEAHILILCAASKQPRVHRREGAAQHAARVPAKRRQQQRRPHSHGFQDAALCCELQGILVKRHRAQGIMA